jgi:ATP-dependent RNA helicase DeaD
LTPFSELGLSASTLRVIDELGFENPSEIQLKSIPYLLNNQNDFIGLAPTGTGKTGAFGWPLLELIDPALPYTQALILSPTRELGQQIAKQLAIFSKYQDKVFTLPVYGGAPIAGQIKALRKTQHIIIATPGRLIDLIKRKAIDVSSLSYLVLDEADEMLNMGFQEEIDTILQYTPEEKHTWLFSATMSKEIRKIVNQYMHSPVEVKLEGLSEGNVNIDHRYAQVRASDKSAALMRFIDNESDLKGVIFCRTKIDTQHLADELKRKKYRADALHGDLQQAQRDKVMGKFRKGEIQILVATDVAARGIDVKDITHVFHLALPDDLGYYTHRSGRTARAGKSGISLAIITKREKHKIEKLQKSLSVEFTRETVPNGSDILEAKVAQICNSILNQKTKGVLDKEHIEKAEMLLHNLSKEELIQKILSKEVTGIVDLDNKDLNDFSQNSGTRSKEGRKRPFKRDRGGPASSNSRSGGRTGGRTRTRTRSKDRKKFH